MYKVFNSFRNACNGLKYCFCTQRNMVIHAVIGTVVLLSALSLGISISGVLFLLTAVVLVLAAEVFNTALEETVDIITEDHNHHAQNAKDAASGAVLLASVFAVLIGLFVLGPPLWYFFKEIFLLR